MFGSAEKKKRNLDEEEDDDEVVDSAQKNRAKESENQHFAGSKMGLPKQIFGEESVERICHYQTTFLALLNYLELRIQESLV